MVKPTCSLMNRTLPSANRKLAPPGCSDQYWSPWARPEGNSARALRRCARAPAPASFRVEPRFGLERHQRDRRVGDRAGPARPRQVLAPLAGSEGLARAIGHLGDGTE